MNKDKYVYVKSFICWYQFHTLIFLGQRFYREVSRFKHNLELHQEKFHILELGNISPEVDLQKLMITEIVVFLKIYHSIL